MTILEQNINNYLSCCDKGLRGEFRLPVKEVSIPLTNVCNNYCIMCHACSKEYKNHTYFNEEPFFVTLEQYKKIVPAPRRTFIEWLLRKKKVYQQKLNFVFGSAETLVNPNIYDVCKYTKSIYPCASIRLISNGTVPPKKDIVRYIDRIGFSIDGATAETFEKLRPPAKFDHVIKTLRAWDESADLYNKDFLFGFSTVVSTANIDELESILRLASTFKHIDSVYLQPITLHETRAHLDYLLLKYLSSEKIDEVVKRLREVSKELNLRIDNLESICSWEKRKVVSAQSDVSDAARYCRYSWNRILSLKQTGEFRYFCCYMSSKQLYGGGGLLNKYPIPKGLLLEEAYNCKPYWKYRKDMLEGKLLDCCIGCSMRNIGYQDLCSHVIDIENEVPYV